MNSKKLSYVLLVLIAIFSACGGNDTATATLLSIAVTPENPSITKGATQQFIATGTYSDRTTKDITDEVTWTSATESAATISTGGLATAVSFVTNTSVITASLGETSGTTALTVAPIYVSECWAISVGSFKSVKNFLTLNTSNLIGTTGVAAYLSTDCSGDIALYVVITESTEKVSPEYLSPLDMTLFAISKQSAKFEVYCPTDAGCDAFNVFPYSDISRGVWTDLTNDPLADHTVNYSWFKIYNDGTTISSSRDDLKGSHEGEASVDPDLLAVDPLRQIDYLLLENLTATEWLPAR